MFFNTTLAQSPKFFLFEGQAVGNAIVVLQLFDAVGTGSEVTKMHWRFHGLANEATLPLIMFPLEHFSYIYFLALVEWLSVFNRIFAGPGSILAAQCS